jgi:3-oxoacyl-[acyl-carrier protein] reductase
MNHGGRIISMSSIFAREPYAGFDAYTASKSGLEGLTQQWAATLGKSHGITANAIICGTIETDMIKGYGDDILGPIREYAVADHSLGTSDDVAQVVAFLASEGSRWVTGQCIGVHGGRIFN